MLRIFLGPPTMQLPEATLPGEVGTTLIDQHPPEPHIGPSQYQPDDSCTARELSGAWPLCCPLRLSASLHVLLRGAHP